MKTKNKILELIMIFTIVIGVLGLIGVGLTEGYNMVLMTMPMFSLSGGGLVFIIFLNRIWGLI